MDLCERLTGTRVRMFTMGGGRDGNVPWNTEENQNNVRLGYEKAFFNFGL